MSSCEIYYNNYVSQQELGYDFAVGTRLRHLVSRFTTYEERLAAIRKKAKSFKICLICVHAPSEDKTDLAKETFYVRQEDLYQNILSMTINWKLAISTSKLIKKESFFLRLVSLHDETSYNGMRL